jgi:hypothetical protein
VVLILPVRPFHGPFFLGASEMVFENQLLKAETTYEAYILKLRHFSWD